MSNVPGTRFANCPNSIITGTSTAAKRSFFELNADTYIRRDAHHRASGIMNRKL